SAEPGDDLAQKFESLAIGLGLLERKSGSIAARPRQTCDQAGADRVPGHENDGDDRRRLLGGHDSDSRRCDNDINPAPDELGRDLGEALVAPLRPTILDRDGATIDPTEFAQPLDQGGVPVAMGRRCARPYDSHGWQFAWLLRARRQRPARGGAADERDDLAPPHSITSSAMARSDGGTLRPSILAVSALMTSSNLVACTTGKSAGFSPLRMRPA